MDVLTSATYWFLCNLYTPVQQLEHLMLNDVYGTYLLIETVHIVDPRKLSVVRANSLLAKRFMLYG